MEQSRGKSTLYTLSICIPREYWNSIDVLFSEKCIMHFSANINCHNQNRLPGEFSFSRAAAWLR